MSEIKEAIIQGGLAEYPESLDPLANAVSSGPNRLVEDATPITLNWALDNPEQYSRLVSDKLVIAHSFGALLVPRSGVIVALDGVEPTSLRKAQQGARMIQQNVPQIGREAGVPENDQAASNREIFGSIGNFRNFLRVTWAVRKSSTLSHLIEGGEAAFPEGRLYLPYADSEYGFGDQAKVDEAQQHGITAELLPGTHNRALVYPDETIQHVNRLMNAPRSS